MDRDRIEGSLLNKAYEMQCLQERQFNMMDMLNRMDLHQEVSLSNEDRLFMTAVRPRAAPVSLTVVAGRVVNSSAYPVNGQQLQLQLDQLTSAMTDMAVGDDNMETPVNTQYTQYIQDRAGVEADPYSQDEKRRDPVYLSSMAAHIAQPVSPNNTLQQQQQQEQQQLLQEQQQKHDYFLAFLQQQQITPEQFVQQQQYYQQLLEHQYAQEQQLAQQQQQLMQQQQQLASGCCLQNDGGRRLMKRPDLLPMQKCTMWT